MIKLRKLGKLEPKKVRIEPMTSVPFPSFTLRPPNGVGGWRGDGMGGAGRARGHVYIYCTHVYIYCTLHFRRRRKK